MLGWVQQALQTALLSLDEGTLPMPQKITACAAVNKVCIRPPKSCTLG
jgi:hypothetical protein